MEISQLPSHCTVQAIATAFQDEPSLAWFDSSRQTADDTYHLLGLFPYHHIATRQGQCYVNGNPVAETFTATVSAYIRENHCENPTPFPFVHGLMGYYTYEYGVQQLQIPLSNPALYDIYDAYLVAYDAIVVAHTETGKITLITHGHTGTHDAIAAKLQEQVHRTSASLPTRSTPQPSPLSPASTGTAMTEIHPRSAVHQSSPYQTLYDQSTYEGLVRALMRHMVDGDIYVANLTQPFILPTRANPFGDYLRLRQQNPAPLSGYFRWQDMQILCTSMERLLRVRNGQASTRPIKGTRKRGATPAEDKALYEELWTSQKDRSELMMITDLERNDMNRCCQPGSVQTNPDFTIETYATVFQLVADIVGTPLPSLSIPEILDSMLPGGSITGAPKHRAVSLLQQYEVVQRHLYTGTIGYVSFHDTADWNIVIRTAVQTPKQLVLQAGGGITAESDPTFEYEETLQKIEALLRALPPE